MVDIDGVSSVTASLTGMVDKPLPITRVGDTWTAVFDPTAERIVGNGTVRVVLRAQDSTGTKSTKTLKSINVRRCDTGANIDIYGFCSSVGIQGVYVTASDPDSPDPRDLDVTIHWRLTPLDPPGPRLEDRSTAAFVRETIYLATIPLDNFTHVVVDELSGTIETRDPFGGTSSGSFGPMRVPAGGLC